MNESERSKLVYELRYRAETDIDNVLNEAADLIEQLSDISELSETAVEAVFRLLYNRAPQRHASGMIVKSDERLCDDIEERLEVALPTLRAEWEAELLSDEAIEAGACVLGTPDVWRDETEKVLKRALAATHNTEEQLSERN
jgi:hypothetical protein